MVRWSTAPLMHPLSGPMEELPVPPPHLFERLAQIPGYTWDHDIDPFHSVSHSHFTLSLHVRFLIPAFQTELRQLACLRRTPSS